MKKQEKHTVENPSKEMPLPDLATVVENFGFWFVCLMQHSEVARMQRLQSMKKESGVSTSDNDKE